MLPTCWDDDRRAMVPYVPTTFSGPRAEVSLSGYDGGSSLKQVLDRAPQGETREDRSERLTKASRARWGAKT